LRAHRGGGSTFAGLDFALDTNTTAGVSCSGQFGGDVQDNAVKGRLTWLF
jgi:hypothetical protein